MQLVLVVVFEIVSLYYLEGPEVLVVRLDVFNSFVQFVANEELSLFASGVESHVFDSVLLSHSVVDVRYQLIAFVQLLSHVCGIYQALVWESHLHQFNLKFRITDLFERQNAIIAQTRKLSFYLLPFGRQLWKINVFGQTIVNIKYRLINLIHFTKLFKILDFQFFYEFNQSLTTIIYFLHHRFLPFFVFGYIPSRLGISDPLVAELQVHTAHILRLECHLVTVRLLILVFIFLLNLIFLNLLDDLVLILNYLSINFSIGCDFIHPSLLHLQLLLPLCFKLGLIDKIIKQILVLLGSLLIGELCQSLKTIFKLFLT